MQYKHIVKVQIEIIKRCFMTTLSLFFRLAWGNMTMVKVLQYMYPMLAMIIPHTALLRMILFISVLVYIH